MHSRKNLAHLLRRSNLHLRPNNKIHKHKGEYIFPARVMTPTVLSALEFVLAPKMRLTASDCAPKRVGVKSPFRVCSELSTLVFVSRLSAEGSTLSSSLRDPF